MCVYGDIDTRPGCPHHQLSVDAQTIRAMHYHHRFRTLCLILLGISGVIMIVGIGLRKNIRFFVTPTQIYTENRLNQKKLRLGGVVKEGSLQKKNIWCFFHVHDQDTSIPVVYKGMLPDLFREGQTVVVEGHFDKPKDAVALFSINNHDIFYATQVLAKHDENYRPPIR